MTFCFRRFAVQSNFEVSVLKCIYSFIYIGKIFHELYQTSNYIALLKPQRRSSPTSSTTSFPWARPLKNGPFACKLLIVFHRLIYLLWFMFFFPSTISRIILGGNSSCLICEIFYIFRFVFRIFMFLKHVRSCYRFILPFKFVYQVKIWHPLVKSLCLY